MKVQCPFCQSEMVLTQDPHLACRQCGRPMLEVFDMPLVPDEWTVEKLTVLLRVITMNAARYVAPDVIADELHNLAVHFEGEHMFKQHREETHGGA